MSVHVYGCNHIAIEVDDIEKAVAFYKDVFNLEQLDEGEGAAHARGPDMTGQSKSPRRTALRSSSEHPSP